jgi:type I restriction enzyme S subunit
LASGTTFLELSGARVAEMAVPLAPLPEQGRIVAIIDSLAVRTARARADLVRVPALVSKYKQSLLTLAFSGQLTATWRQLNGSPAPCATRLADILAIPVRNGLSVRGSDNPPGIRALRLSALRGDEINLNDVRYLRISSTEAARFLVNEGDILISRGNGTREFVGIGSRVPKLPKDTIFPDTAFRIRLKPECALPRWFVSIWNSPQVRTQIESTARTTAGIWKISQADLAQIQLSLPSIDEQAEIVGRIETAFAWVDRVSADHATASNLLPKLDAAILTKAFRGELALQDPNDESAEVLLARIHEARATEGKTPHQRATKEKTMKSDPKELLLSDAQSWPAKGLPFEEIAKRVMLPHDEMRDALFALLGGEAPKLRQVFDKDAGCMHLRPVSR